MPFDVDARKWINGLSWKVKGRSNSGPGAHLWDRPFPKANTKKEAFRPPAEGFDRLLEHDRVALSFEFDSYHLKRTISAR